MGGARQVQMMSYRVHYVGGGEPAGEAGGAACESPQQRTHRKKHNHESNYFQAPRKPEFVLRLTLLYPSLPNGLIDLRVSVGLQHKDSVLTDTS